MEMHYQTWSNEQIEWIGEMEKAYRKTCNRQIIAAFAGSTISLFVLGCFVGGIKIGLQNAFFGMILGLMIALLCGASFAVKSPRKRYLKSLKKEMESEFPELYMREQFASKMLEENGESHIRKITWERSGGRSGKVEITKEYAVRFSDNSVSVVNLEQVERMELDAQACTVSVRNDFGTVRTRQEYYPIQFYYYPDKAASGTGKKKTAYKRFIFPSRTIRDDVAKSIEEMI